MTGLVGWWPLNEDSGSTAYDLSGNGNHGSLNGGVTQGVAGKGGMTAYSFDGSDDYVSMGDFFDAPSSLTLSAWVKFDSTPNSRSTVITKGGSGDDSYSLEWNVNDGGINFYVDDSNGNSTDARFKSPQTGVWYHILGVYDAETARIFVDGELKGSSSNASGSLVSNTNPVTIARRGNNSQWHLDGNVADVRIYDRALTPQEIQTLYEWGNGDYARPLNNQNSSSAVSRWAFDGNADDLWGSNAGTLKGNLDSSSFVGDSIRGQSLSFDGGDDYVEISGDQSHNVDSDLSVVAWFKSNEISSNSQSIVHKWNTPYTDQFSLRLTDGEIRFYINDGGTVGPVTSSYQKNEWYFVVGIYDSNEGLKLFKNGFSKDSYSYSGNLDDVNDKIGIGGHSGQDQQFDGLIDDIRIYDRALSASEVFELYQWGTRGRDMRKLTVNSRGL